MKVNIKIRQGDPCKYHANRALNSLAQISPDSVAGMTEKEETPGKVGEGTEGGKELGERVWKEKREGTEEEIGGERDEK